jgi:hypothetical protein
MASNATLYRYGAAFGAGWDKGHWALSKRKPHMLAIEEACGLVKDPEAIPWWGAVQVESS